MEDLKEPVVITINGSIEIVGYESKAGPAFRLSEAAAFHEHNHIRLTVADFDAMVDWYQKHRAETKQS